MNHCLEGSTPDRFLAHVHRGVLGDEKRNKINENGTEKNEKSVSDEKSLVEMNKKERIQWYMENLGITEEQAQSIIIEKPEETREDKECLK